MPLLLSEVERETLANYRPVVVDETISSWIFSPIFSRVSQFIPPDIAPNVLSLAALVCTIHAWFLTYAHLHTHEDVVIMMTVPLIGAFWVLDRLDEFQAERTKNQSSLTVLFDHCCSNAATVFVTLTLCEIFGFESLNVRWCLLQSCILIIFTNTVRALKRGSMHYAMLGGPGEALFFAVVCLVFKAVFGARFQTEVWPTLLPLLLQSLDFINSTFGASVSFDDLSLLNLSRAFYFIVLCNTLLQVSRLPKEHSVTRNYLFICLVYRLIPAGAIIGTELSLMDVIADGLSLCMIMSDLVVARMAKRQLHPWIPLFSMFAIVSNFSTLALGAFYYYKILTEICDYTHSHFLSVARNVYVDGVYDLCHIGHMVAYANALQHGTRLIVGVCGDDDVKGYKRMPIMSMEERCRVVSACKYVYKVVPNAPCTKGALDEEFLKRHNIHVVCCGEEYDKPDDQWYAIPRRLGILKILPRTKEMSTSQLIDRIKERVKENSI
eukprot:c32377_g1_i1.p1 GENE.c32377_g1_i1~~c32377_g1_i1.p1  ORF type:complete len:494 (+),score=85.69 c32377_g1_i1:86-1567(+)